MTDQITNVYWYESSRSRVRIKLQIYSIRTIGSGVDSTTSRRRQLSLKYGSSYKSTPFVRIEYRFDSIGHVWIRAARFSNRWSVLQNEILRYSDMPWPALQTEVTFEVFYLHGKIPHAIDLSNITVIAWVIKSAANVTSLIDSCSIRVALLDDVFSKSISSSFSDISRNVNILFKQLMWCSGGWDWESFC